MITKKAWLLLVLTSIAQAHEHSHEHKNLISQAWNNNDFSKQLVIPSDDLVDLSWYTDLRRTQTLQQMKYIGFLQQLQMNADNKELLIKKYSSDLHVHRFTLHSQNQGIATPEIQKIPLEKITPEDQLKIKQGSFKYFETEHKNCSYIPFAYYIFLLDNEQKSHPSLYNNIIDLYRVRTNENYFREGLRSKILQEKSHEAIN